MATLPIRFPSAIVLFILAFSIGCDPAPDEIPAVATVLCDEDDGAITLPPGFCALVVADDVGRLRHLAVRDNGDVYAIHRQLTNAGGITALRDTTGDGRADVQETFGRIAGTGIRIHDGFLYASSDTSVHRFALTGDEFVPPGEPETIVGGLPDQPSHEAKSFTFDDDGNIYVNVGGPSNACQEQDRMRGSPAPDPCPELERQGGVWRFRADVPGQTQLADGHRFATGIRNAVALAWDSATQHLYVVQHGRDLLDQLFPDLFTAEQNAELPSEEFQRVTDGSDFGWPYCYYDHLQGRRVLAPEYGGDGTEVGRCADKDDPIFNFPGHYAPNDLLFYSADQFPARYRDGAFVAFHGSWNRAPLPQEGYLVAFLPFEGGEPADDWEVFADNFKGVDELSSPGDARFRPMGLSIGPDGSLYVSDSQRGRIWRILHTGP